MIEYRVREVSRYIVTRYSESENCADSRCVGEFDNADTAYQVGYAVCKNEHFTLGWPIDDPRIKYPSHPNDCRAEPSREAPFI